PAANTALLQILVPENAEVLVEGSKTTTIGTVRDFISPPLTPGKNMTYAITVRYPDAGGKTVEETHSIRVRANDQLRIDCSKQASSEQPRATVLRP
ncbi:MAG: TIGR03000 domain-containing protein, partial [Gemmataceae bacterium]